MRFESKKDQNEKKKHILQFKNRIFTTTIF